jgi:hypothetical protein
MSSPPYLLYRTTTTKTQNGNIWGFMDYRLNYAFLGDLVALEGTFNEKELKKKCTHLLRRKN